MSLVLVFFMAKKISLFQIWRVGDAVNVILLLMEKGAGFFSLSQRCSKWICLISAASLSHSWISSAGRLSLWLVCSLCWAL